MVQITPFFQKNLDLITLLKYQRSNFINEMSFIRPSDFKTKQQELRKRKRDSLKREAQKFSANALYQKGKEHVRTFLTRRERQQNDIFTLEMLTKSYKKVQLEHHDNTVANFKNDKDRQIYQMLQSKLQAEEQRCRRQKEELQQLEHIIQLIKTENAILRGIDDQKQHELRSKHEKIKQQNQYLKQKTYKMEQYLIQNGACLSINGISDTLNICQIKRQINSAKNSYRTLEYFSFQSIVKRIDQLNENLLTQKGSTRITNTNGIFQLCQAESISVLFYRNGIYFDGIGFYAYHSRQGLRITKDLNDGYFPHILKYRYPEGVFMKIEGKLMEDYNRQSPCKQFLGEGHLIFDE